MSAKVLPFPVRPEIGTPVRIHYGPDVLRVYGCAGRCGALVSSPDSYCLACAVEDAS